MTEVKKEDNKSECKLWFSRWSNFNMQAYRDDMSLSVICWSFAFLAIVVVFQTPIQQFLNYFIVDPFLSLCKKTFVVDIIFLTLLSISLIFFVQQIRKHKVPTLNSLVLSTVIFSLYYFVFKNENGYVFYHFTIEYLNQFTYSFVSIFSMLILSISYRLYQLPLTKGPSRFSFIEDSPSIEKYNDVYSRSLYAESVAKHLESTSTDESFAVGVIGDWGSGKSDFMNRLKKCLEQNNDNIVFTFNPWRINKVDGIVEEFFNSLSKHLEPFNQSIGSIINDYSSRVLKGARETQLKLIDALIDNWFQEKDIHERYKKINDSIKATSKRLVVFIDDVDRLTAKEIIEVLRIIRNTASFANTFFIVSIDQKYIIEVLKNTKEITNEEEYLKKVFQLTITLPTFKKQVFTNEFKKHILTSDLSEKEKRLLSSNFSINIEDDNIDTFTDLLAPNAPEFLFPSLTEDLLDNLRDLKRFCNSFKLTYNLLKDEVEIKDLILLELIRNKNILVYNAIRDRTLLKWSFDNPSIFSFDEKEWETLEAQLPVKDRDVLKRAVSTLLTDSSTKNQRKLLLVHNFYIYFSYQLFNNISFRDFNETITKDPDEVLKKFEEWISQGKGDELFTVLSYLDDFYGIKIFGSIIEVLTRISGSDDKWFGHAKHLIYVNWKFNHSEYFNSDKTLHKAYLLSLFNNEKINLFKRAVLANTFLSGIINGSINESEFAFSKIEIQQIIYDLFNKHLNSEKCDHSISTEFYYLNDDKRESSRVILYPPATSLFKQYLLQNDSGFSEYLKLLLRPAILPYNGSLVLEPWLEQIFSDWILFKERLLQLDFSDSALARIKVIVLKYLDEYFTSGKKPFKIDDKEDAAFFDQFRGLVNRYKS